MTSTIQILDGGLGSDLFINGGVDQDTLNDDPLWLARYLLVDTSILMKSHVRFINAGCDIITTGSYQASVEGFVKHAGITKAKAVDIIGGSVDIARKAIKISETSRAIKVAGSISPYGAILHDMSEYTGSYIGKVSADDLKVFHETNVSALVARGVDFLAIETIPALSEATAILEVLQQCSGETPAWVSFSTDTGKTTSYGDSFEEVFKTLAAFPSVKAIGINCCKPEVVDHFIEIAKAHLDQNQKLILYPDNRKKPEKRLQDRQDIENSSGLYWLPKITSWLDSGLIGIIGGCCMVKPSEISEIRSVVQNLA